MCDYKHDRRNINHIQDLIYWLKSTDICCQIFFFNFLERLPSYLVYVNIRLRLLSFSCQFHLKIILVVVLWQVKAALSQVRDLSTSPWAWPPLTGLYPDSCRTKLRLWGSIMNEKHYASLQIELAASISVNTWWIRHNSEIDNSWVLLFSHFLILWPC